MQTGKSFLVENRPGASGSIAVGAVAKSAPDGHTLVMVPSTYGTASALYSSLPYSDSELVPVALVGSTPYVFVLHPSIAANTFPDLIKLLKQNPGKYEFASSSPGTAQHLGGELVKRMAGVDMLHVPYKGSGALLPDLLSGRVPMMFENVAIMMPHIRKGSLKPLAISSAKRSRCCPACRPWRRPARGWRASKCWAGSPSWRRRRRRRPCSTCLERRTQQDDRQPHDRRPFPGARRRADGRLARAGRRLHRGRAGKVGPHHPRRGHQGELVAH